MRDQVLPQAPHSGESQCVVSDSIVEGPGDHLRKQASKEASKEASKQASIHVGCSQVACDQAPIQGGPGHKLRDACAARGGQDKR